MFCPNCGSKVTDGSMFCHSCGVKLDQAAAQPAAEQAQTAEQPAGAAEVKTAAPEKKVNGYSIASLILGICGFIFPIFICRE